MDWFDDKEEPEVKEWGNDDREKTDEEAKEVKSYDFWEKADKTSLEESSEPLDDDAREVTAEEKEEEPEEESIDLEAEREEARQEGYDEGYQDGLEEGRKEREELEQQIRAEFEESLEDALDEVHDFESNVRTSASDAVVKTARILAEKILRKTLELNEEDLISIASDAVRRAAGLDQIGLYAHPKAVEILEEHIHQLRQKHPDGTGIELHDDQSLEYGDIRIQSETGAVESILEDRLDRLQEVVSESLIVEDDRADGND